MRVPFGNRRRIVLWVAAFATIAVSAAPARASLKIVAPVEGADLSARGDLALVVEDCVAPKSEKQPGLRVMLDGENIAQEFQALPWKGRWVLKIPGATLDSVLSKDATHWLHVSGFCPKVELDSVSFSRGARSIRDTASRVARRALSTRRSDDLGWDWSAGMLLFGLDAWSAGLPAADRTVYRQYLQSYYRRFVHEGFPEFETPAQLLQGSGIVSVAVRDNDLVAIEGAYRLAEWLRTVPRNSLGAIDSLGTSVRGMVTPDMISVDELMAIVPFSVRWARYSQDAAYLAIALAQVEILASRMQDQTTGLFKHAWLTKEGREKPVDQAFWLRGNGYAGWAMVELLQAIGPMHPEYSKLLERYRRWAAGVRAVQLETGLYDQMMNLPGYTDEETSGSALVAASLARGARLRLLDVGARESAAATWRSLASRLSPQEDGTLSLPGVSKLTTPRAKFEYGWIRFKADLPHGVGALLLLASELQ